MRSFATLRRWIWIGALVLGAIFETGHAAYAEAWKQAVGPWKWAFPRDHGSHLQFRTEWWYFTGNLTGPLGTRWGYQLTFFRQGIRSEAKDRNQPWSIRDLYLGHFALTDASASRFWYGERLSREGPGLAGASEKGMDVWLLNWRAKQVGAKVSLEERHEAMALSLAAEPLKPTALPWRSSLRREGRSCCNA